jgi:Na+/proline symporter/signal transduction histidine kinase
MSSILIISISAAYLALLFLIAYWGEHRVKRGKSLINNPYIYTLSLTAYCTAWTYYGSVGQASREGIDFITIFLGPTLIIPFWWLLMRKIIRICRFKHITTIADFISSRYGKSSILAVLVTIVSLLSVMPYIALQLKAISSSFSIITANQVSITDSIFKDTTFLIMWVLVLFTILFGTRSIETTERHEGLITAIAFESLVKLIAFLSIGIFVTFFVFDGFEDIFSQASSYPELLTHYTFSGTSQMIEWFFMTLLSMLAFLFLPRQFQVSAIENVSIKHLDTAFWLFPLYLFLINVFVIPIAFGGYILFGGSGIDADTYVLALPLAQNKPILATFVYIGGFSAATSMIIISTIALSVMLCNNLILPLLVSIPLLKRSYTTHLGKLLLYIRRLSIVLILHLAYLYYTIISNQASLMSIGLISFVGIAQFAPAIIGGVYWRFGNKVGALWGLLLGFMIWFYTLILPTLSNTGFLPLNFVQEGLWEIYWLRPHALFGLDALSPISQSLFWSLLLNTLVYVGCSLYFEQSAQERNQAEVFVNIQDYYTADLSAITWKGTAYIKDLQNLLINFLGKKRAEETLRQFSEIYGKNWQKNPQADVYLISYAEKLLSGTIGVAATRIMIASVVKEEEEIRIEEVVNILRESQQLISLNKTLQEKSNALERASHELTQANAQLQKNDEQKNEFISTVTHEMRTPITSIRAFSEILYDNEDLDKEEKQHFLSTIIKETNRMERLINQVLELEKFESGEQKLKIELIDLNEILQEAITSMLQIIHDKKIKLIIDLTENLLPIHGDYDQLTQVVLNLLSNATKFCKSTIQISTSLTENHVRMSICDDGIGVKPEFKQLIFEKFYQAENQNLRKPKGSGLGLAICKKIIQYHEGEIWVESKDNKYANFIFALPILASTSKK